MAVFAALKPSIAWLKPAFRRKGTTLVTDPEFAKAALAKYPDMLTAGIDAKNGEVAVAGWREGAGVPAEELIAEMGKLGFKHLVYTDISRDGMQTGIDAARYVEVARVFGNPVIARRAVWQAGRREELGFRRRFYRGSYRRSCGV